MAADELTGNMATENLIAYLNEIGQPLGLNPEALARAREEAGGIFAFH